MMQKRIQMDKAMMEQTNLSGLATQFEILHKWVCNTRWPPRYTAHPVLIMPPIKPMDNIRTSYILRS